MFIIWSVFSVAEEKWEQEVRTDLGALVSLIALASKSG